MSAPKRAKHIYFDIEYWRDQEKKFADYAAKYATDDNTRSAIIARCRIDGADCSAMFSSLISAWCLQAPLRQESIEQVNAREILDLTVEARP